MGAGSPQGMGQQGAIPQSAPGNYGGFIGKVGNPAGGQMQPQAQPQGLGALQNAYSGFMNQQPPQPNPMFGQQPQNMMGNLPGSPQGPMSQSQAMASPMGALQTPPSGALQNAYSDFMNQQRGYGPGVNNYSAPQQAPMGQTQNLGATLAGGQPGGMDPMQQYRDLLGGMGGQMAPGQQPGMAGQLGGIGQQLGGGMQQNPMQSNPMQAQYQAFMNQQNGRPDNAPMGQMPQAPTTQQIGQEDPRMQAMRNMQRYRGFQ